MILGAEEQFRVGVPEPGAENYLLSSTAANAEFQVMFEDDGTTGYFYAVHDGAQEAQILDALHIYNVESVGDRDIPVTAQIFWNETQTTAVLILGGYCHALYDFQRRAGFCRTAFPPARLPQAGSRELTDELVETYFAA